MRRFDRVCEALQPDPPRTPASAVPSAVVVAFETFETSETAETSLVTADY
jgi:hypothetical protein